MYGNDVIYKKFDFFSQGGLAMQIKTVQEWRDTVTPILLSKQAELRAIGYTEVTIDQIWDCLFERIWKGNKEKKLYEIVQDIFHLRASIYMGFMTVNALQDNEDDLMASINALMDTEDKSN